jgi:transcriptional regulator with XRE-family HTH domain
VVWVLLSPPYHLTQAWTRLGYTISTLVYGHRVGKSLCIRMNLTQVELARFLGVSRGAVLGWEAGGSYPKAEHLKRFIALGVQQRAFVTGREEEEIRALWRAAHQKVLLDEAWLSSLLDRSRGPDQAACQGPGLLLVSGWSGRKRRMCRASMDTSRNWPSFRSGSCRNAAGW